MRERRHFLNDLYVNHNIFLIINAFYIKYITIFNMEICLKIRIILLKIVIILK